MPRCGTVLTPSASAPSPRASAPGCSLPIPSVVINYGNETNPGPLSGKLVLTAGGPPQQAASPAPPQAWRLSRGGISMRASRPAAAPHAWGFVDHVCTLHAAHALCFPSSLCPPLQPTGEDGGSAPSVQQHAGVSQPGTRDSLRSAASRAAPPPYAPRSTRLPLLAWHVLQLGRLQGRCRRLAPPLPHPPAPALPPAALRTA